MKKEMSSSSNSGTGDGKTVKINMRMIGPSPPSSLDVNSPIKMKNLYICHAQLLNCWKLQLYFADTLIVAVKPKPPAKHIQNEFEEDEEELKFQLPELNNRWEKRLFLMLHDKLKIPDMLLMAIFSLSLKAWAVIIMWFILAPIAHKWEVGPLYILGTGFAIIFLNLGKRQHGDMSAYSIFNEDFRELPGTFNAERVDRDIRAGQL